MMSFLRREPPGDQRPRRRRRLAGFLSSTNQVQPEGLDEVEATSSATSGVQVPVTPLTLSSSPTMDGDDEWQSLPDGCQTPTPTGQRATSIRHPIIPMNALLSKDQFARERPGMVVDALTLDYNSDDDDDVLQLVPENDTYFPPTVVNHVNARTRVAISVFEERRRFLRARRGKMSARLPAPPVLFLYELDGSRLNSSEDDETHSCSSARYLALVRDRSQPPRNLNTSTAASTNYTIHHIHRERIDAQRNVVSRTKWVSGEMPVELFEAVTQHLSRDDIKSMRLVCKEFERGVSRSLFNTVVVPFNTELYDMIEQDKTTKHDFKGKGRADDTNDAFANPKLHWKNAIEDKENKLYKGYGLRVFEGFGYHIRRFGMSFEVKEDALCNPPQKRALDQLESYFGSYDWPSIDYTRFEKLAGLERTADETSQMKAAFSHLHRVQHLALCIDSGLGWLSGPDKSMRSRILQRDPPVFGGCSHGLVDAQQQERYKLWETLETAYTSVGKTQDLKEGRLHCSKLPEPGQDVPGLANTIYRDTRSWPNIDVLLVENATMDAHTSSEDIPRLPTIGVLYVEPDEPEALDIDLNTDENERTPVDGSIVARTKERELDGRAKKQKSFSPAHLNKHQKEWLLEAAWAQRAFVMSYMLAIVDNSSTFSKITVLNLARVSSGLMPLFYRYDFWDALPNLEDVSLGVIPDWRTVDRDDAGFVETKDIEPSQSHDGAYRLLRDYISVRKSIKKLKFAWAAGGEHATGCVGRNNHVLPAPITLLARTLQPLQNDEAMLKLPHIERLTLANCWISPPALVNFVLKLESASLKRITLDSVSLTAHPRNVVANGGNQNAVANNPGGFQLVPHLNALPPQMPVPGQPQIPAPAPAQQFAAMFWLGPPAMQNNAAWAQNMLHRMQQMITQNGIQYHELPQMVLQHPAGTTLGQIAQSLTMLATGGPAGMFWVGNQLHHIAPPAMPNLAPGGHLAQHPFAPLADLPWHEGHREGSWVKVTDILSPGPTLEMCFPSGESDPRPAKRETPLISIEFISCGYVQLQSAPFDQTMLEDPMAPRTSSPYFHRRRAILQAALLNSSDKYLGRIIQSMPEREQDALRFTWDMKIGWNDEKKAEEAEYDGFLPGGSGRFSGLITKESVAPCMAAMGLQT